MKWIVTIEIDDPKNLIPNFEFAMRTVEDLVDNTDGHRIAKNCDFKVTFAEAVEPEIKKDPENLGVNQKALLTVLREHGNWHNKVGWTWHLHPSGTKKILDSLVRKGLVQVKKGVYTPV